MHVINCKAEVPYGKDLDRSGIVRHARRLGHRPAVHGADGVGVYHGAWHGSTRVGCRNTVPHTRTRSMVGVGPYARLDGAMESRYTGRHFQYQDQRDRPSCNARHERRAVGMAKGGDDRIGKGNIQSHITRSERIQRPLRCDLSDDRS